MTEVTQEHPELDGERVARDDVRISAIDRMFDAPDEVREGVVSKAFEIALPRVQALCRPADPNDPDLARERITAISEPKPYTTPQGTVVDLRLCVRYTPSFQPRWGNPVFESVGLLVGQGDNFAPLYPVLELSEGHISAESATTLDRGSRSNQAADLEAIMKAIEFFDGQGLFPEQ